MSSPHVCPGKRALSSDASSFTFEAETKQLLDIVANSLYTDKEVSAPRADVASEFARAPVIV